MSNDLLDLHRAGQTLRCHTELMTRYHNVAEHSHGVALICWYLERQVGRTASSQLLIRALFHDLPETTYGDWPAPAKWRHPELRMVSDRIDEEFFAQYAVPSITPRETKVLKYADMIDFMLHCLLEAQRGAFSTGEAFSRAVTAVYEMVPSNTVAITGHYALHEEVMLIVEAVEQAYSDTGHI